MGQLGSAMVVCVIACTQRVRNDELGAARGAVLPKATHTAVRINMRAMRHLRFQRIPPSRESSKTIPRSASCWRMRSDVGEIACLARGLALGDERLDFGIAQGAGVAAAMPSERSFSASSSPSTAKMASKVSSACAEPGRHRPARNSPRSMAVLASRTRSKIAASACAVFRSSSRPCFELLFARARRVRWHRRDRPAEIFRLRTRATKLRSRSTELAACCRPSSVKFSWRR